MGGLGSSRYGWSGPCTGKDTVHQYPEIDIRHLAREITIEPKKYVEWNWPINRQQTIPIGVLVVHPEKLALIYQLSGADGRPRLMKAIIKISYTKCNFGGERPWFNCPACTKRIAKIYFGGNYFFCRHCYNLTYRTCQISGNRNDQAIDRLLKIIKKFECDPVSPMETIGWVPDKPTGMHWRTYRRLKMEYFRAQREWHESFLGGCRAILNTPVKGP